jgi:site-specific recombinase XerD
MKLTNQARHWLERYLSSRKDKAEFVFIGHDRTFHQRRRDIKGLTPRSVERIIKKHSISNHLNEAITPETFRKNFTAGLIKKGESSEDIKKRLGFVSENYKKRFSVRSEG